MSVITRKDLVEAAERAQSCAPSALSRADFERETGISQYHIYRLFPEGGWTELKVEAGIDSHPQHRTALSDSELLEEFHSVVIRLGHIPTWAIFHNQASVSADVVRRRFGGTKGTQERYRLWLEENHPNDPLPPELQRRDEIAGQGIPEVTNGEKAPIPVRSFSWERTEGSQLGPPLNFRGLQHAPINEQGVVFLFGMVSAELGFLVEAVQTGYPDCEAKRKINNDRWQRVRIEFEYQSRNFRDHGHDPAGCDLIVCWEHNWSECPASLEVLELRSTIRDIDE
jgi:hypothetical protein